MKFDSFGALFGQLVRDRRGALGWTQANLAAVVFASRTDPHDESHEADVSKLESGRIANPQSRTVSRYADARGITEGEVNALRRQASMTAQLDETGGWRKAKASGITDEVLIALARCRAQDVENPEQAFRELEAAVEVAIRVQAEGRVGSKHGDFVDTVLARVAELSRQGQYDAAVADIDAALAQEAEESAARTLRLLDAGIAQDTLRRDPAAVAARLLRKAEVEGKAGFEQLRSIRRAWSERGLDTGTPTGCHFLR